MICDKCGTQLPEGVETCSCSENAQPEQPVAVKPEQPEQPEADFAQAGFDAPVKKKKSKKGIIIGIVSAVVLIAAAVWLVLFSPWFGENETISNLRGNYIKSFGSSDEYAQFVANKTTGGYVDSASSAYGKLLASAGSVENVPVSTAGTVKVDFVASEDAITLLENYIKASGAEMDLDWLNSTSLLVGVNTTDKLSQIGYLISMDGQTLADLNIIYDFENCSAYAGVLNLSDKYLGIDLSEAGNSFVDTADMTDLLPGLIEQLPTEEQFEALLGKYVDVYLKYITDTTVREETVEIGGIKQELTVIEYTIDSETAEDIMRELFTTAKDDKELESYIRGVANYLEQKGQIEDADEVYGSFLTKINTYFNEADPVEGEAITVVNYVDDSHRIVGSSFISKTDDESTSYVAIRDGDKLACSIELGEGVEIIGEGSDKDGLTNAEYSIKKNGTLICKIVVTDCRMNSEDGITGTVSIKPTSALLSEMGIDPMTSAMMSTAGFSLEIKMEKAKCEINIKSGNTVFAGIHMTYSEAEAKGVTLPSSDSVIAIDNIDKWGETLDLSKLIEALRKTTFPKEITDMLEQILQEAYSRA